MTRLAAASGCALALAVAACTAPLGPSTQVSVDVLDFVVGNQASWPRIGNQHQDQVVEASRVCWTKYSLAWMFECWRWDDQYLYHQVDHGVDAQRWVHYSFSDGRWLPRRLMRGQVWSLDLPANLIRWVDADCVPQPERPSPYRLRAWIEPSFDAGGEIGVRDTLMLEYEPYDPQHPTGGLFERFYFAKGAGWFQWTRSDGPRVTFNQRGGSRVLPTPLCLRDYTGPIW